VGLAGVPSQVVQLQMFCAFSCAYAHDARLAHMSSVRELKMLEESHDFKADEILPPPVVSVPAQQRMNTE
jgi:hypothetical protein